MFLIFYSIYFTFSGDSLNRHLIWMTFLVVVKLFHTKFLGISMRNIILYPKNWSTWIFLISLLMFDGEFGQIKHIIYRLGLPSALFGIEMFTICWNFQNCIFVCYHIWRHILPYHDGVLSSFMSIGFHLSIKHALIQYSERKMTVTQSKSFLAVLL